MSHIINPELSLQIARDRQAEIARTAHIARHASEARRAKRELRHANRHRTRR